MACPDFEEVVRQGPGGHAARCEECAALLEALAEVDAGLESAYGAVSAPPGLAGAVRMRIAAERDRRGPSPLPEVLDFIAWAAILALVAVLTPRILPVVESALANFS